MATMNAVKGERLEIGLEADVRRKVADALNEALADEFALYVKTRNFHWNVAGPSFGELHKFFEQQYQALEESIDAIAERVRALGHRAAGSMARYLKETGLKESPESLNAREMLGALLDDHEAVCRSLRPKIDAAQEAGDGGTADFLTGLLEGHEKTAWMTRAYLG
jgi:starvation-inducible DNA-binding protein